jgi:hypothetical protein
MKLYSPQQALIAAKSATLALILIIVAVLLLSNCSGQSHFSGSNQRIKKVVVYCGQFESIIQANKRLSIVTTDKTKFFIWGLPDIEKNANLYITFTEETIMPTMNVHWVPYLVVNENKYKINEEHTSEEFYSQIVYADLDKINYE